MNLKLSRAKQCDPRDMRTLQGHTPNASRPGAKAGEGLGCGKQWDQVRSTHLDQGRSPNEKESAGSTQFLPLSAREQRKGREATYGFVIYSLDPSSFKSNDILVSEERWQVCGPRRRLALRGRSVHRPAS